MVEIQCVLYLDYKVVLNWIHGYYIDIILYYGIVHNNKSTSFHLCLKLVA